jgi:homoserine dehydrogenase
VDEFLSARDRRLMTERTTLKPHSGEPAISHIRVAFSRKAQVITANKGSIAHAYAELKEEEQRAGVEFRLESTALDGTPVFNQFRNDLPGIKVLGFTGVEIRSSEIGGLACEGKTVLIVSRGKQIVSGVRHTDLTCALVTISINPGLEQTAYGFFSDLVKVAKSA